MTITCPENDTIGVCATMDSAGAGLGVFVQYMGIALPPLLVVLAIVGVIAGVGVALSKIISRNITHTR